MIKYNDPQTAFEAAIQSGRLSRKPDRENYAGSYMYMGTTRAGDMFKNIITRAYLPYNGLDQLEILAATTQNPPAGNTGESRCWPRLPEINEEAEDAMKDALYDQPQHFPGW